MEQGHFEALGSDSGTERRRFLRVTLATGMLSAGSMLGVANALAADDARPGSANMAGMSMDTATQAAIKACLDCHSTCLEMAMTYCVQKGGRHVEAAHLGLLMNCAEICQTSANFMLSNSPFQGRLCGVCAEVCEACARNCEQLGEMTDCAEECRRCAKICRSMA
jgi:hypothetical protein